MTACQPGGPRSDDDECATEQPAAGEVVVQSLCGGLALAGGEQSNDDTWLANSLFRVVVRHPQASATLAGVGGGTLVDGAAWGEGDWLHEAAPLVAGGWLDVEERTLLNDGVRLAGTIVSLPDAPAEREGEWAEVTWRIRPDDPWLRFEGADGLYLHAAAHLIPATGWMWSDTQVYGHDGVVARDLGGALRIEGASGLLIADPLRALEERAGNNGVTVSGTAVGAQRVVIWRSGQILGWFPVHDDGTFEAVIPADSDAVYADASGRAPSVPLQPGPDLALVQGLSGSFEVRPAWSGAHRRPLVVRWSAADGRSGEVFLPDTGGSLFVGFGRFEATVSAGPSFESAVIDVEVNGASVPILGVDMVERFDPDERVLAALGWPADRSRTWRGTNLVAAKRANTAGADYAVFAPEDDISAVSDSVTGFPKMAHANGSITTGEDWSILSWPWNARSHQSARGAVDARHLTAPDALAAAVGGPTGGRHTVVDLPWLLAAPRPWAVDPTPEGVYLTPPGADGPAAWAPWFEWLDASVPLSPVGPLTWVPVTDTDRVAEEDILQGFTAGRTTATTGPLLTVHVGAAGPGEVAKTPPELASLVSISLRGARDLDHLALVGEGGNVLSQYVLDPSSDDWDATVAVPTGRWVLAMAWSEDGNHFAGTSPVWVDPP